MKKIANWITHHVRTVIIVSLLLLIPSLFGTIATKVNYDILSYLPSNLDSTRGQEILDQTFHNSASSMLIVENMPAKDVKELKEKIEKIPGVTQAMWTSDLLDSSVPPDILPDVVKNIFYSRQGNSTMMIVRYEHSTASEETANAIRQIKSLMNKECFLSGLSAISVDTQDLVSKELPLYIGLAVLLCLIVMFMTMESWLLPLLFLLSIGLAVAYNFGSNIIFGQISYITQAIAAILQLGVTMDYSIFLIDRYEEECAKHKDHKKAMGNAISRTFSSLFGSSLTTLFGFLALCFMRLTLGRDIGLVMAKGVVLGVLTVVLILPAFILAFDKPIHKFRHKTLVPNFSGLNRFVTKHKKVFACLLFILIIPAFLAQKNAPVYYDLTKSLPQDMTSVVALEKMKKDYNMASTHFVLVKDDLPDKDMGQMTAQMEKIDGIESVLSISAFLGPAVPSGFLPDSIKSAVSAGGYQMMMVNSNYSSATDELNHQVDELNQIVKRYDPDGMITGEGALTKDLVTIANTDFMVTNLISIAAIFVLIALLFRSISIPTILVACIELSIFINLGIPFLTGKAVPFITPTVIGCVQLGATVDYAILMATRFREEMRKGHSRLDAIQIAANASNRSIFTSALVFFCATFGVYLICNIDLVKNICFMLARGAIISSLVIMFILTPLLLWSEKLIAKTTFGWKNRPADFAKKNAAHGAHQ